MTLWCSCCDEPLHKLHEDNIKLREDRKKIDAALKVARRLVRSLSAAHGVTEDLEDLYLLHLEKINYDYEERL